MASSRSVDNFVHRTRDLLEREYIVIGTQRVSSWVAWPLIMFLLGITVSATFVASRDATLQGGSAAEPGLVAHWRFDETSGTLVSDSSGNNITGSLGSGAALLPSGGKMNGALLLDGGNGGRVTTGDPAPLKITGPLTIASWVYLTAHNGIETIFSRYGSGSDRGYQLIVTSAGKAELAVAYTPTTDANAIGNSVLALNTWYHLTGVYEPGVSARIYVNGVLEGTRTTIPNSIRLSAAAPAIGQIGGGWNECNCRLDDLRVYTRALTVAEIQALANPVVGQVATPSISPQGGSFGSPFSVSLTSQTSGAEIRYTLDGSAPTQSSLLYATPFTLSSSVTVKAKAFKPGLTSSDVATAVFTFLPASAAEPVWPGTSTRYYPGIYVRANEGNITGVGNTLNQWWGSVDRNKYREYHNGNRVTHIGIKVQLHSKDFFSSYWHNSSVAPYNYKTQCNNSTLMQNPDAVINGQKVYNWDFIDSVLDLPLIANGEAKVIFYYDDQDIAGTKGKWWESQGMLDNSGAHPKKYDWVYTRFKMDFLKALATRYKNNPKIAALHFEEFAGVQDSGPTCGYVIPGEKYQISAENGTFFYPAKAVLEADPGLMVFKVGPAVTYLSQYFNASPPALDLNDLPGTQGIALPDSRFFVSGCGSGSSSTIDCDEGNMYWFGQQALVQDDLPVMTHAERNGWRSLYDGSPPNTRRSNAQNPWGVSKWPSTDGDWDGENIGGVQDGSSHTNYAFPDPMFWVWYFSGPPRATGAAADSRLGQVGPDPAGVIPSVFYEPIVPWCTGWGCVQDITSGWNGINLSIQRYLKAFETFGPSGTKAMFAHPDGYLESFGDGHPPSVSLAAPASGSTVSGTAVTVSATASDNVGVAGVQFKLDGANLGTEDTAAPYSIVWNSTLVTDGPHTLSAVARDAAGNTATSGGNIVTVSNIALPDTQAPTIPTGVSATAVSSSQINLSWSAATDNVGVTQYQIERCQGSSCANFSQIATSLLPSYANINLLANTTYRYRLRAADAAGNLSGYSNIVNATTHSSSIPPATARFQNQLHVFGGDHDDIINHALQLGYDWIAGQPWSRDRAVQGKAAGLKVMFNSTAGDEAKWLQFNNPGGVGSMQPPTLVNGQPITPQMYGDFKKMFLMKDASAPDTDLKRKYWIATQYEDENKVLFLNNYRCSSGIDLMVKYNEWLYNLHGGSSVYEGLFLDQVNYVASLRNAEPEAASAKNPCLTSPSETVYATLQEGQLVFIRRIRDYFKNTLGAQGVSGNPFKISSYSDRHPQVPLDFYYNEQPFVVDPEADICSNIGTDTNPVSMWGGIPPHLGAVQLSHSCNFLRCYHSTATPNRCSLHILGNAAKNGAWFGSYGGGGPIRETNAVQLSRAIPNWDNLVNATGRTWNASTFVYSSSNSHADPNIIYGRQWKNGKLFVVWNTIAGKITLRSGETINSVKCTNSIFVETTDCTSHVTQTGNQVSLNNSANVGKGYVITLQSLSDDTVPPTISITAPTPGSTVSGSVVTVSANALDSGGIAGVQFKLNGNNLGAEDTAAPYSISWDTTLFPNGEHALSAVARDMAGNVGTSASVPITVNNTPISSKFAIGDKVEVTAGPASIFTAAGGIVIGIQQEGAEGSVIGGPMLINGVVSWNVNFTAGVDGWANENNLTHSFLDSSAFRNQFSVLSTGGLTVQAYIEFAKQWGYEWVVGDPWSGDKAKAATEAGLKVMFNSNAREGGKWYNFDNPGTEANPGNPTKVNLGNGHQFIDPDLYAEMEKTLCMTDTGVTMEYPYIYQNGKWKFHRYFASFTDNTIIFVPNHLSAEAITANVNANLRVKNLHEEKAGKKIYHGLYFDETNFPGNNKSCSNPINGKPGDPASYDAGRKIFMRKMIEAFKSAIGSSYGGTSGNVWRISNYDPEHQTDPEIALDVYYSESSGGPDCDTLAELISGPATGCGSQNSTTFGVIPKALVDVQMAPTGGNPEFETSYKAGQLIAGRAAWQGIWFGWFGAVKVPNSNNATQLMRAVPNWDNRLDVPLSSRSWNEAQDIYSSPNSYIDNGVAYSRRWNDGKLFVVWNTNTAPVTLRAGENVTDVKCVNNFFSETTDCESHVTVSTTNPKTIRLNNAANELKGYIITLTGGTNPTPVSNVSFTLQLEARPATGKTFTIRIVNPSTSQVVYQFTATADTAGKVVLPGGANLLPGTYHIYVSFKAHLVRRQSNVVLVDGSTVNLPPLPAGDFNDDGIINSFDWSTMNNSWFSAGAEEDINSDATVNSLDFSYLNKNWNKIGD